MKQTVSVEEGFVISLIFFLDLWSIIKPNVLTLSGDSPSTHKLFFLDVCTGFESSAEWNEAIFRSKKIPKQSQKQLKLNMDDLFLSATEFCKLHNERYEGRLDYALHLLESMKNDPKKYLPEWTVWKNAINKVLVEHITLCDFDWSDELPEW